MNVSFLNIQTTHPTPTRSTHTPTHTLNAHTHTQHARDLKTRALATHKLCKHTCPHNDRASKTQRFLLNETCVDTHLQSSQGKDNLRKFCWDEDGEKVPLWECLFVHRKQGLFLSVYVDDIKMTGKKQNVAPMWKKWMELVDLDGPTSVLDHVCWGCTQRECKPNEAIIDQCRENVRITSFCYAQLKNNQDGKTSQKLPRGHTTWKDMSKSA